MDNIPVDADGKLEALRADLYTSYAFRGVIGKKTSKIHLQVVDKENDMYTL